MNKVFVEFKLLALNLNTKTQRNKVFSSDTKITSDLKVATKPCGRKYFVD